MRLTFGTAVFYKVGQNSSYEPILEVSMFRILWWIVVGLVAGWATGKIMRGGGYGTAMDIVIGIAGALVGGWIMHLMGFSREGGLIYTILVAIGGAVLLTFLFRLFTKSRGG